MASGRAVTTTIRPETAEDILAIFQVNALAFGRDNEARLVDELRSHGEFDPRLSLVAVVDDQIVGHILFPRIEIADSGRATPALALAPMAVLPLFQNQGIGTALVVAGLESARTLGHRVVVVLGHAHFYSRFGFVPAGPVGIKAPFPAPDEAFRVVELASNALLNVRGVVQYPSAFSIC